MSEPDTEELLAERRPRSPRWIIVAVLAGAVVVGTAAYAVGHSGGSRPPARHAGAPPSPSATTTTAPIAEIDTAGVLTLPPAAPSDAISADSVLIPGAQGATYTADGSAAWTADFANFAASPVRLAGPIQLHVSPLLHAQVTDVFLRDGASPVVPGSNIYANDTVRLTVKLQFDCAEVRAARATYPSEPITVVMFVFGYGGAVVTVLGQGDPGSENGAWASACPGR